MVSLANSPTVPLNGGTKSSLCCSCWDLWEEVTDCDRCFLSAQPLFPLVNKECLPSKVCEFCLRDCPLCRLNESHTGHVHRGAHPCRTCEDRITACLKRNWPLEPPSKTAISVTGRELQAVRQHLEQQQQHAQQDRDFELISAWEGCGPFPKCRKAKKKKTYSCLKSF